MDTFENLERSENNKGGLLLADGKLYFSRHLERKIYFALTVAMLLAGLGYRFLGG
jgi:hypothetical protein